MDDEVSASFGKGITVKDFQDLLKNVMEADDDAAMAQTFKRPTMSHVRSGLEKANDPDVAIQTWVKAHTQEYNALKSQVVKAIELLKELYNKLPDYDTTTMAQAHNIQLPPKTMTPERQARLDAAKAQFQSRFGNKGVQS